MSTTTRPARPRPRTAAVGSILLALGTIQFFVAHLVAQAAWTNPAYSWWNNYISDLGATVCGPFSDNYVCSPLHPIMNTAFVLQGMLMLTGITLIARSRILSLRRATWPIMIAVTGISWILVGLIPEDVNLTGHSIGALPIFILGNTALVTAGISDSTRTLPAIRGTALALGVLGLVGFGLTVVAVTNPTGPIGIGIAERITVFPAQVWAFTLGIGVLSRLYAGRRRSSRHRRSR
ncbi:DUF998 domain-containing protein [Promicromonospora sp. NPDC059942]|uniref:DUF998 domain-containing protein n=1 Tax=Promicromonospora sp. NPDC059942 TaxID=3347009 RepID=UPI00364BF513